MILYSAIEGIADNGHDVHCPVAVQISSSTRFITTLTYHIPFMDPIGILSSVISTASFLIDWMEARKGQERTLNDIHTTVRDIRQSVLLPLVEKSQMETLDPRLAGPLETLHDVLRRAQDHLVGWEQSRSKKRAKIWATVNPWAIQDKLKDDERKLMVSMQILTASMMTISITTPQTFNERSPLDISTNPGVRKFWAVEIGEQVCDCWRQSTRN